ncbi:hypothetical protein CBL_05571 [Carabus blaptoides fortunei]
MRSVANNPTPISQPEPESVHFTPCVHAEHKKAPRFFLNFRIGSQTRQYLLIDGATLVEPLHPRGFPLKGGAPWREQEAASGDGKVVSECGNVSDRCSYNPHISQPTSVRNGFANRSIRDDMSQVACAVFHSARIRQVNGGFGQEKNDKRFH